MDILPTQLFHMLGLRDGGICFEGMPTPETVSEVGNVLDEYCEAPSRVLGQEKFDTIETGNTKLFLETKYNEIWMKSWLGILGLLGGARRSVGWMLAVKEDMYGDQSRGYETVDFYKYKNIAKSYFKKAFMWLEQTVSFGGFSDAIEKLRDIEKNVDEMDLETDKKQFDDSLIDLEYLTFELWYENELKTEEKYRLLLQTLLANVNDMSSNDYRGIRHYMLLDGVDFLIRWGVAVYELQEIPGIAQRLWRSFNSKDQKTVQKELLKAKAGINREGSPPLY